MGSIEEAIKQSTFNDDYHKSIVNLIYTHNYVQQCHAELFKKHGLTNPQFNILRILRGQHPQPSTINLLIERMLDKSSNASRIVDKLESKKLVDRKQCKNDRRAVDVYISEQGLKLLQTIDLELAKWYETSRKLTSQESKELNKLLDKLRD